MLRIVSSCFDHLVLLPQITLRQMIPWAQKISSCTSKSVARKQKRVVFGCDSWIPEGMQCSNRKEALLLRKQKNSCLFSLLFLEIPVQQKSLLSLRNLLLKIVSCFGFRASCFN